MKILRLLILLLALCGAASLTQSQVFANNPDSIGALTCPPGSFYSESFQSCMPSAPETRPQENPPSPQCPPGYVYNLQNQSCGKGSDSGNWNTPPGSPSRRCSSGSYYDDRLQKCIKNRY